MGISLIQGAPVLWDNCNRESLGSIAIENPWALLTTAIEPREPRDRANSRSPCALSLGSLGSNAVVNRAQGFSIWTTAIENPWALLQLSECRAVHSVVMLQCGALPQAFTFSS